VGISFAWGLTVGLKLGTVIPAAFGGRDFFWLYHRRFGREFGEKPLTAFSAMC
jgi:hypothetical protein